MTPVINGTKRCVAVGQQDETVTFIWSNTTNSFGHNVNHLNKFFTASKSYEIYKTCDIQKYSQTLDTNPQTPNKEFTFGKDDIGYHFFVCGIGNGYHCEHGHVRAVVQVVADISHCDFHTLG